MLVTWKSRQGSLWELFLQRKQAKAAWNPGTDKEFGRDSSGRETTQALIGIDGRKG